MSIQVLFPLRLTSLIALLSRGLSGVFSITTVRRHWFFGRAPKNRCLRTMMLEKTPESPLDSRKIKPVNLKGNQPWILFGRTDAEAEAPVFWSSDANSRLTGKVPDAGKDWRQKEKRVSEDEMAGWRHQFYGHELGQTSGDSEGQKGLVCCSPWGCKELDMLGRLNNSTSYGTTGNHIGQCRSRTAK